MTARTLAAAALVAVIGTALAQPPKAIPLAQPKVGKDGAKADRPDPAGQLAARVTIEKFDGKFGDAVKMLSEKYELALVVDPRVGEELGAAAMCEAPADDRPVTLPKFVNVRLDTVLKLVAEQVGGKFLVYPDHVKIVPAAFAEYESGVLSATDETYEPLLSPIDLVRSRPLIKRGLVNVSFKNKPLGEALDEIAEATGATIAVSPLLAANVRQAPVTVRFANTPVESAVRTLCEMTECAAFEDASVLVVTTRERAAARAKEDAQKSKDRQPLAGFAPQPDLAGEVARLKEQNELFKKELDELKKLLKK